MTTEDRKRLAGDLREALSLAEQRRSAVHMSQYHAGLILDLLRDESEGGTDAATRN